MRKLSLCFLICFKFNASAQNNDYMLSFQGIGKIKLGMTQVELEKLLNTKFTLKHGNEKDTYWLDTVDTKYKNMNVMLILERRYSDDTHFEMALMGVKSGSSLIKTPSGIIVGTDKMKLVTIYENYSISIWPEYADESYITRSKTKAVFQVFSNEGDGMITYYLTNKKVSGFEVSYGYGD